MPLPSSIYTANWILQLSLRLTNTHAHYKHTNTSTKQQQHQSSGSVTSCEATSTKISNCFRCSVAFCKSRYQVAQKLSLQRMIRITQKRTINWIENLSNRVQPDYDEHNRKKRRRNCSRTTSGSSNQLQPASFGRGDELKLN